MFTQRALDFLYFNHKNNSKEWYDDHKTDYREFLVQPFADLVRELTPTMLAIDPEFIVEPKVDRCISRIYKDMRFCTDGYKYRDKMWLIFIRDKRLYNGLPGYFFELSPYGFNYGCGYYRADDKSLGNFRQLIIEDSKLFKAALECYKTQKEFTMYGDLRKLPEKYKFLSEDAKQWLSLDNIGVIAESKDIDLLTGENLGKYLSEVFMQIKPFYDMMLAAELMKK